MSILIGIFGTSLLLLVFYDFFITTLSFNGFGFLSKKLNWWLGLLIIKSKNSVLFTYSGIIHLLINSAFWLCFLILAIWITFLTNENMVINSSTNEAANALERLYFTCYSISTVGLGDFRPGSSMSQLFFNIISFSGFIMLTLNITFLLSIIQAVKQQKILAFHINCLGKTPEELTDKLNSVDTIDSDLKTIRTLMITHIINHYSYPIIQYFISLDDSRCAVVQCLKLNIAFMNYQEKTDLKNRAAITDFQEVFKSYMDLKHNKNDKLIKSSYTLDQEIQIILNSIGKNRENLYQN